MKKSRAEVLLEALLEGKTANIKPQSRVEKHLLSLLNGETVDDKPKSRIEAYLSAACANGVGGGGGGGGGDTTIEDGLVTGTLTEYTNDRVESVGTYAFCGRRDIKKLNFPKVKTVGGYAFQKGWYSSISLPLLEEVSSYMCESCPYLTSVHIPNAKKISESAFRTTQRLTFIDLPSATFLGYYAFGGVKKDSMTIILRSPTVCSAQATTVIDSVTLATIYVPAALIETYQNATNWSSLYANGKCTFVAIEGSEYE